MQTKGPGAVVICALLACAVAVGDPRAAQAQPLHAEGRYIREAEGAVVVLRGLNVAGDSKVPPFRPIDDPMASRARSSRRLRPSFRSR